LPAGSQEEIEPGPLLVQSTDLMATVRERLASKMVEAFGLSIVPHPATLPEIAINIFWHAKFHRDPVNKWLRGLILDNFAA
jgi:DNA-binding transcriptional LysR family regulator